jgi:hypothetical protein
MLEIEQSSGDSSEGKLMSRSLREVHEIAADTTVEEFVDTGDEGKGRGSLEVGGSVLRCTWVQGVLYICF